MRDNTCVFIGHRQCHDFDTGLLKFEMDRIMFLGVSEFLCGGMGEFDRICAGTVRRLKRDYPHVKCTWVIPYYTAKLEWEREDYDEIIFPEYKHKSCKARIVERNRYMADASSAAICHVRYAWGGAAKTFEYARKRGLIMINI